MTQRKSYNPLLKSYPDSEKINRVSEGAEVLYVRLLAASDDDHHYYADAGRVLAKLFTERMLAGVVTEKIVDDRLGELARVDLIRLYEVGGKQYLEIVQCFKRFRKDVKFDKRFPGPSSPPVPYSARTGDEGVTDAGRARAEYKTVDVPAASDSDPTHTHTQTQPKGKPKPEKNPLDEIQYPDGLDTPQVREIIEQWLAYRRRIQKPYKDIPQQIGLLLKKYTDPTSFAAAVDNSIAQGHQGCYPPGREQYGKTKAGPGQRHPDDAGRTTF